MSTTTITPEQVMEVVMTLPPDRLISVYDFALFVKAHPLTDTSALETEADIRSDEEHWDQQFAASGERLRQLAREAAADYRAGKTNPMKFTSDGRLAE